MVHPTGTPHIAFPSEFITNIGINTEPLLYQSLMIHWLGVRFTRGTNKIKGLQLLAVTFFFGYFFCPHSVPIFHPMGKKYPGYRYLVFLRAAHELDDLDFNHSIKSVTG